jgi:hypothetical protein
MKIMAIISMMAVLSAAQMAELITQQAQNGASPSALWQYGFQLFYRQGFPSEGAARRTAEAYRSAAGQTPAQKAALKKAEKYWLDRAKSLKSGRKPRADLPGSVDPFPLKIPSYFKDPDPLPLFSAPR